MPLIELVGVFGVLAGFAIGYTLPTVLRHRHSKELKRLRQVESCARLVVAEAKWAGTETDNLHALNAYLNLGRKP